MLAFYHLLIEKLFVSKHRLSPLKLQVMRVNKLIVNNIELFIQGRASKNTFFCKTCLNTFYVNYIDFTINIKH